MSSYDVSVALLCIAVLMICVFNLVDTLLD